MTAASLIPILFCLALGEAPTVQPNADPLLSLLEQYLTSQAPAAKDNLASRIRELANGDVAAVTKALARVQLWPNLPAREGLFEIDDPKEDPNREEQPISFRLPKNYDAALAYPAILCVLDSARDDGEAMDEVTAVLGSAADDYVLIRQTSLRGNAGHGHHALPNPAAIVRAVSRRIHLNHDRIFLLGNNDGASSAWHLALFHPHIFAGAIIVNGFPDLPYPAQTYPFLLENLRLLPVLVIEDAGASESTRAHLDGLRGLANDLGLPMQFTSGPATNEQRPATPLPIVGRILANRRASRPVAVAHWFRYPHQGRAGWLNQTEFNGDVWRAEALSIAPSSAVDRNTFIAETVKNKMAYIGGRVDGQRLEIETKRCARIDIALWNGLLDWNQPITVFINGQKRYEAAVSPDIPTLLESVHRDWDFTRPRPVRLSFTVKTDAP